MDKMDRIATNQVDQMTINGVIENRQFDLVS